MTTATATLNTIDTARQAVARVEAEQRRLTALQKSPELRANAHQRQEIGLQLDDLNVQLNDARAALLRAEIDDLNRQGAALPDLTASREAAQEAGNYAINVLPAEQRKALEEARRGWGEAQLAHENNDWQHKEMSKRKSGKREQLQALTGEYYDGNTDGIKER